MRARLLVGFVCVAVSVVGCSRSSRGPGSSAPPASPTLSTVRPVAGSVAADGLTPAIVTIVVRDGSGAAISGAKVTLGYSGAARLTSSTATTDGSGSAEFRLTAESPTVGKVTATVSTSAEVELSQEPALAFHGCAYGRFVNGACAAAPFLRFPPAAEMAFAGAHPMLFAVGDLDGNGLADAIVPQGDALEVLLADGAGSFLHRERYEAACSFTTFGIAIGDVTGDAIADVVGIGQDATGSRLAVVSGKGDGALGTESLYVIPSAGKIEALADLDGDGDRDLVIAVPEGVGVLLNAGDGSFGQLSTYAGEGTPQQGGGVRMSPPSSIALADLDGNGTLDAISAYKSYDQVEVRLGNGDGSFGSPVRVAVGTRPMGVAAGDVNGDGVIDVVTANDGATSSDSPRTVSLLLGNGNGTLAPQSEFATGPNPGSIAVGDLDGDGRADVVTSDRNGGSVSVLRGRTDGTLGPPASYEAGHIPWGVALARLDADARPDVVVLDYGLGSVNGILNRGDGRLAASLTQRTAPLTGAIAAGDVNGDGYVDVVGVTALHGVFLSIGGPDGLGWPIWYEPEVSSSLLAAPRGVALADLDGDSRSDAIVTGPGSDPSVDGLVSVFHGQANGTLGSRVDYPTAAGPTAPAVGDVNADGWLDIVVSEGAWNSDTIGVLLGSASGTFSAEIRYPAGEFPRSTALGDLNGDSKLDVVVQGLDKVSVLLGDGKGGFGSPVTYAAGTYYRSDGSVALADLDRDGFLDVVAIDDGGSAVSVFHGNGDGTLAPREASGVGPAPVSVSIADVNGDGALDAVTAGRNGLTTLLPGAGDGTFGAAVLTIGGTDVSYGVTANLDGDGYADLLLADVKQIVSLHGGPAGFPGWHPLVVGRNPMSLLTADLDGDANRDLVVVTYDPSEVRTARGNGDGTFQSPAAQSIGGVGSYAAVGDMNGDGLDDVVALDSRYWESKWMIGVFLSNGDGTLQPEALFDAGADIGRPALADVNGDGKLDVVAPAGQSALVFLGDGAGVLSMPVSVPTLDAEASKTTLPAPRCVSVRPVDVNGDGGVDLVSAYEPDWNAGGDPSQGRVTVVLGGGGSTFESPVAYAVGGRALGLLAGDIDGDGHVDVIATTNWDVVEVLRGAGDGSFSVEPTRIPMGGFDAALSDMDGDGDLDLVTTCGNSAFAVHRNDGAGTFDSFAFLTAAAVRGIAVDRLDGDARPDVLLLLGDAGVLPLLSELP